MIRLPGFRLGSGGFSRGQQNLMKTLSENERKVIGLLSAGNGEMKRNILERKSGLAKSSLASCLNMLERKKVLEIDKTSVVHFVRFTGWFREL